MGELKLGAHTYGNITRRGDMNTVTVGKYCSIAANVVVDSGFNHDTKRITTYPFRSNFGSDVEHNAICKGDIIIGNDVWICENVLIMGGVTIGDGAVIGANSIVTRNVEAYSIVAGSPARHMKYRFPFQDRQKLMKIKWWEWPHEVILERAKELNSYNINDLDKYL